MSQFVAQILAQLDTQQAEAKLKALTKNRDIDLKVKVDDNDLKNLARKISKDKSFQITAHLKDTTLKNIQHQLESMANGINIDLSKAFNIGASTNAAKKYGQQVGSLISDSAEKSIKNVSSTGINKYFKVSKSDSSAFNREMDKLVSDWTKGQGKLTDIKIQTRTYYDKDEGKNIERLHQAQVTYNNELGETIKKTIAWKRIGTTQDKNGNDIPLRGFVEVASQYSKSIDEASTKTDNFIQKQKNVISKLSNQSKDVYRDAIDKNTSKPIKDQLHLDEIERRYKEINTEIGKLGNLNGIDFTNQENYIDSLINDLKIYKREARNAESTATALRSKPIDVVRDETFKKLQGLESDIKKVGVSSKELTTYINDISTALADPNIDASGINDVLNTMSKARAEMDKLKKESSAVQSLEKAQIKADGLSNNIKKAVTDNAGLNTFKAEINGVEVSITSLLDDLSKIKTTGDVSVVTEKWKAFSSAAKEAGLMSEQATDNAQKLLKYTDNFNNGHYSADAKTMASKLNKYANQDSEALKNARAYIQEYNDIYKDIKSHFSPESSIEFDNDQLVDKFKSLETAASKYKNAMKEVSAESSKTLSPNAGFIKSNEILSYYNENTKAAKKYGQALKDLANEASKVTTQGEMDSINEKFKLLKSTISSEGLTGKSWFDDFKRATSKIAQFAGIYGVLQNVVMDVPRQMVQAVKDVDSAMTNLYKVTDATTQKYDEFLSKTGETAKSLGRDISSYIEQTSEWAKLGYNIDQSANLAKVSSMYANVAEVDDKTAVSDLVTVLKAYNMQDTQAIQIGDMLNELGNRYATSAADLGTGLSKMASTMSMSGVSLQKALAILTGGVEITQDADALGNAIKISVLRMRGQKGALEELGEYADDVESVSKMQTQILNMTKGAVNIMDAADPTSFRDYYDVMKDISEILPTLSETDQANLIETLFGKNRANQGQAILQAFQSGQIQKAYETAMNSQGSMQEEQDKWLQSAEADFCLVA